MDSPQLPAIFFVVYMLDLQNLYAVSGSFV